MHSPATITPSHLTPFGNRPYTAAWSEQPRQAETLDALETDHSAELHKQLLVAQVEQAKAALLDQRTRMLGQMHEPEEGASALEELDAALRELDGIASQINTALPHQLAHLHAGVSTAIDGVRHQAAKAEALYGLESGLHMAEIAIEKFGIIQSWHDERAEAFHHYERQSFSTVEHMAAARGIDIEGITTTRTDLLAERAEAEASGNRPAMFRADALLGHTNVLGLVKVGADEATIDKARKESNARLEDYLREVEMEAALSAEKDGLTGEARRNFIDQARTTALGDYRERALESINAAELTPEQRAAEIDKIDKTVSDFSNANKAVANERTEGVATPTLTPTGGLTGAGERNDALHEKNDVGMTGGRLFDASSALGNSAMLGAGSLDVAEADPAEEKTPAPSPTLTGGQPGLVV